MTRPSDAAADDAWLAYCCCHFASGRRVVDSSLLSVVLKRFFSEPVLSHVFVSFWYSRPFQSSGHLSSSAGPSSLLNPLFSKFSLGSGDVSLHSCRSSPFPPQTLTRLPKIELNLPQWHSLQQQEVHFLLVYGVVYCIHVDEAAGRISMRTLTGPPQPDVVLDCLQPGEDPRAFLTPETVRRRGVFHLCQMVVLVARSEGSLHSPAKCFSVLRNDSSRKARGRRDGTALAGKASQGCVRDDRQSVIQS